MADAIAMADLDLGVATTFDQLGGRETIDEFFTADRAVTTAAVVRDEPPAEGVSILLNAHSTKNERVVRSQRIEREPCGGLVGE